MPSQLRVSIHSARGLRQCEEVCVEAKARVSMNGNDEYNVQRTHSIKRNSAPVFKSEFVFEAVRDSLQYAPLELRVLDQGNIIYISQHHTQCWILIASFRALLL
jgi:hypothetical protein